MATNANVDSSGVAPMLTGTNDAALFDSVSRIGLNRTLFTCPITLDIMENPVTTTPCGHMFDMDAINEYLTVNNTCPVCRTVVA
ncbi:unnamed protein product, partial [Rotaria sp. Silwood2]